MTRDRTAAVLQISTAGQYSGGETARKRQRGGRGRGCRGGQHHQYCPARARRRHRCRPLPPAGISHAGARPCRRAACVRGVRRPRARGVRCVRHGALGRDRREGAGGRGAEREEDWGHAARRMKGCARCKNTDRSVMTDRNRARGEESCYI